MACAPGGRYRAGTGDIGGHAPGTPGDAAGCGDVLMDEPTEAHKRTGRDVDVQGCVTIHGLADKEKTSQILTVGFCMVNRRCLRI